MHSTPFASALLSPLKSRRQFELQRVSRQGRLNLQAARAMAEELCGQARRLLPATTVAADLQCSAPAEDFPAFMPPAGAFDRAGRRPF